MKYFTILATLFFAIATTNVQAQSCCPTSPPDCCVIFCKKDAPKCAATKASVSAKTVANSPKTGSCSPVGKAVAAKSCAPATAKTASTKSCAPAATKTASTKSCGSAAKTVANPASDWSVETLLKLASEKKECCSKTAQKTCAPAKVANSETADKKAIASKE